MRLTKLAVLSTGLCLSLFACRGGGDGDDTQGDDTPMADAPPGGVVKVKDVQNDTMPVGTAVEVRGVVVTAVDQFGNRTGDFFVQDMEGGAFSGIKVFGAPLDQVAGIQVGDIVDITNAEKDEFALTSDMTGRKVTELKGAAGGMMTVTKKSSGATLTPETVDAKAIAMMDKPAREAEWEKWEGVLVKVTNARQLINIETFGSTPGPDSTEFRITGVARVQSALVDLPAAGVAGTCYESIVGVGDYFFNDLVLPRTAADLVPGGAACNPMSNNVVEVQTGGEAELAKLTNVVVTAIDDLGTNQRGFWVADDAQAALNNGVYVFTRAAVPAGVVVGARVDVVGAVDEFDLGTGGNPPVGDTITEVVSPSVTVLAATAVPLPLAATAAQVSDITTGEPYEGVLVKLANVKVTATAGQGKLRLTDNAGGTVIMDDDSFVWGMPTPPAVGTCYPELVGVMNVQFFDDIRTVNPRSVADMVTGTGCTAPLP